MKIFLFRKVRARSVTCESHRALSLDGSMLDLLLCCCCPEISNTIFNNGPCLSFCNETHRLRSWSSTDLRVRAERGSQSNYSQYLLPCSLFSTVGLLVRRLHISAFQQIQMKQRLKFGQYRRISLVNMSFQKFNCVVPTTNSKNGRHQSQVLLEFMKTTKSLPPFPHHC